MKRYDMVIDQDGSFIHKRFKKGGWVLACEAVQIFDAFKELVEWARDVAGDCEDPAQRVEEDEMMARMERILEKHRND